MDFKENIQLNKFPAILRYLREQHNLSLEELANEIGVSKNTLFRYENGLRNPNLDILIRISNYFGVSLDYLVGRNEIQNNVPDAYIDLTNIPKKARESVLEFYEFVKSKYGNNDC